MFLQAELQYPLDLSVIFIEQFLLKMKLRFYLFMLVFGLTFTGHTQNMEYIYNQRELTFYGLDFSHAKMIGPDFENTHRIVNQYFDAWNGILFEERDKYNVERLMGFRKANYQTSTLNEVNSDVNPNELRSTKGHRINRANMFSSIQSYSLNETEGLGLVIFVESFNEFADQSSVYYAFFDIASRDVIVLENMIGKTGGLGLRNNWANSIHYTMDEWLHQHYRQIALDKVELLSEKQRLKYSAKLAEEHAKPDIDYFNEKMEKRIQKEGGQLWDKNYYKPLPIPSNTVISKRPLAIADNHIETKEQVVAPLPNVVSQIDVNIPQLGVINPNRYALIIGNEDYQSYQPTLSKESNVDYANRDAETFKLYAERVMGIPTENIVFLLDAKVVELNRALIKMKKAIELSHGKAEVVVYYAGHGFPDQNTKIPYLIPVDVSANDLKYAFPMNDIYNALTEFESKSITVYLDACFSGGARNKGLMTARGVKIKPKKDYLHGNIVIFSAASGTETAQPLHKERHGLFTYYLLKKVQETKGNVSYEELYNYLKENVGIKSVFINESEQTPGVTSSPAVGEEWKKWKFN